MPCNPFHRWHISEFVPFRHIFCCATTILCKDKENLLNTIELTYTRFSMQSFPLKSASSKRRLKMFTYSATFKSFGAEMLNFVAHCSLPLEISLKKIRALELRCLIWWRIVISFNTVHALQFTSRVAPKWLVSLCHWAMSFVVYILALSFLTVTARRGKVNIYLLDIILCSLFMSILYVVYLNPVLSFFYTPAG